MDNRLSFVKVERKLYSIDADLKIGIGKNVAFVPRYGLCTMCGMCEAVCPEDAVAVDFSTDCMHGLWH